MLFSKFLCVAASLLIASVGAMPNPDADVAARSDVNSLPQLFELEKRKGCSGDRKSTDVCTGKKLRKQNSFHNCGDDQGKCCAENSDGSGGLNTNKGKGREDCGYCFSGKCSG